MAQAVCQLLQNIYCCNHKLIEMDRILSEFRKIEKINVDDNFLCSLRNLRYGKDSLDNYGYYIRCFLKFLGNGRLFIQVYELHAAGKKTEAIDLIKFHLYGYQIDPATIPGGFLKSKICVRVTISIEHSGLSKFLGTKNLVLENVDPAYQIKIYHDIFFVTEVNRWFSWRCEHITELDGFDELWKCTRTKVYLSRPGMTSPSDEVIMYDRCSQKCTKMTVAKAPKRSRGLASNTELIDIVEIGYKFLDIEDTRSGCMVHHPMLDADLYYMRDRILEYNDTPVRVDTLEPIFPPPMKWHAKDVTGDFAFMGKNGVDGFVVLNIRTYVWRHVHIDPTIKDKINYPWNYRIDTDGKVYTLMAKNIQTVLVNVEDSTDETLLHNPPRGSWTLNKTCLFENPELRHIIIRHRKSGRYLAKFYFDEIHGRFGMYDENHIRCEHRVFDLNIQNKIRLGTLASVFDPNIIHGIKKYIFY